MSATYELIVDADKLIAALLKKPKTLQKYLSVNIRRAIIEIAREVKSNLENQDAVATGQTRNSVLPVMEDPLTGIVGVGTDYARAIEDGTDKGGSPSIQSMIDWIKAKKIVPDDPGMTREDLAYVFARQIALYGTEKKPFLAPALETKRARVDQLVDDAIDRTLAV